MHTLNLRSFLWFTTGVVLTITSIATFGAWRADAAITPGESTFVPITPCRLFDTRPAEAVPDSNMTPFTATETRTQQVTGTVGKCTIPTGISGVAMNLTSVGPTATSFVVVFPADETTLPPSSNLNPTPGQSATPNKVDVKLSPDGKVKIYNNAGTVDLLGDIVGYYSATTLNQFAADISALQATISQQQAQITSLLEDTNVIPSGVTVSGFVSWDHTTVVQGSNDAFSVEMPGRAPVPLTSSNINFASDADSATIDDDVTCTGSEANPTAPPGKVCLYLQTYGAVTALSGNVSFGSGANFAVSFTSDDTIGADYYVYVHWAYTAP